MKQSRGTSLLKSLVSTGVGFVVAYLANMIILPLFGLPLSHAANFVLTCIYTVISIARGFALERAFEALGWRTRMSAFALAVLAERQRQIHGEGWSTDHDDDHDAGELARAGAAYAAHATAHLDTGSNAFQSITKGVWRHAIAIWPWEHAWWKPISFRRDLVKAGALIIAEGERHDRNRKRKMIEPEKPWPRKSGATA